MATSDLERLRELCEQVLQCAEADPDTTSLLTEGIARLLDESAKPKRSSPRRKGRRDAPVLDPFEVHRETPDALPARLATLNLEQLRDIVAYYGMDARRLVMKWKSADRVVAHIVDTVETRSRKGDAFRAPRSAA